MDDNTRENHHWRELIAGDIPPWVMRFIKLTGKAVNKHEMIRSGDSVLSCLGGKDSSRSPCPLRSG